MELDLAAWLECYLADCEARGVSSRTLDWYRDRGTRIVSFLSSVGITSPSRVRRAEVSSFFGAIRERRHRGQPLSSQTILGYWAMGKGFFTFLICEGAHPGPNPFDQFGKPIVRQKAMWAPSTEQCAAMLKSVNRRTLKGLRDLVMLYLILDTGMRVSALAGLRVGDIDLAERRIRVIEKGQHERILPFGVQTMRWLRRYVISAHLQLDDPLFPGYAGKPISRKRIDEIIKRAATRAGVREGRVSAHDLRRSFAREFLRNGGDLESLRQLLGHSSYAMVRRYAELAHDVVAEKHRRASPGDRFYV
jgi:integrase/recombinase XerD